MLSNFTYRLIIFSFTVIFLACNPKSTETQIQGRWKVVKAEVDGYTITDHYTEPHESWLSFGEEGTLLGGRELSDHYGKWKLISGSKLHINSSSPKWNDTRWKVQIVDSVLYLKGTKMSNNYTQKLWLVPAESKVPPFQLFSDHDKRLSGTWKLLRVKKNSKLISLTKDQQAEEEVQITFQASGIYNSTLPGEDKIAGTGVWDLDEYDQKLSLFPFKAMNNKSWDYSFVGDVLRLTSIETIGQSSMKWEWLWQKSSSALKDTHSL